MRLNSFLNELSSVYGKGLTMIDIDETIFKTFAMIHVIDKNTDEVIRKLNNQEYNTYELKSNEHFDFHEFRDAKVFRETSIPIKQTIKRIKRMFQNIDIRGSKVVLLTARADFDDKKSFLKKFKEAGLPIDQMYVERVGNFIENPEIYKSIIKKHGMPKNIADAKRKVILNYLSTGEYRRVRLIDDNLENLLYFLKIEKKLPKAIIDKIKQIHDIKGEENIKPIEFYALQVLDNGKLKRIK